MVSDEVIASCVDSLLRQSPPGALTSLNGVVRQLEAKLGVDLSHKTPVIRDQIDFLLGHPRPPKDHFALHPHPQFQPHPLAAAAAAAGGPHAHQFQIPSASSAASSSPFTHFPVHHELSFRYPPPQPISAGGAQHPAPPQQFQQQQPPPPPPPVMAAVRPAASSPKESASTSGKRRGGPGGLSKVCGVSPELQAIVGEPTMARTQIVKQLWAYIRKNNLQDPNNKRKIICNDELRMVFETDCTDMFKMNKLLAKHIKPLEPTKVSGSGSKRLKLTATASEVASAAETDASQYPVLISDALAEFFGTGERKMLQSEALKRVWDYIKLNNLEDPMNTMVISCDFKLQQLFGCEELSALGVSEMLTRHLFKQS